MLVCFEGGQTSPWRALQKTLLQKIRLVDIFNCVLLFANGRGYGLDTDRSTIEFLDNRPQNRQVHFVKPGLIHFNQREGDMGHFLSHNRLFLHLGIITDPSE